MRATASFVVLLLLGACSPDASESAASSLQKISDIRSGELALDVSIAPSGEDEATGFSLEGLFSLPEEQGALPEADLLYTQRADGSEAEGRFIADGETVTVEVEGESAELPPEQVESFRVGGDGSGDSVFGNLDVESWFPEPETEESGDAVTLSGELDVIAALNDIFEIAESFGATLEPIEGDEADIVRDSVRSATGEITSDAEDGLLRHLVVEFDFGVADPDLAEALGPLAGATFTIDLAISNVNETVDID